MNGSVKEETSWIELNKEKSQSISNDFVDDCKSNESLERITKNLEKDLGFNCSPKKSSGSAVYSGNSNYFTPTKTPNIRCKLHSKDYLIVDIAKFKVHCGKCLEKGDKNKFLEFYSNDSDEESEIDVECSYHPNMKGLFYCDDCQVFLCKLCFANEHRSHKSNLPSDIATSYKQNLQGIVDSISQMKPRIDESLKSISEIDKKIKVIRDSSNVSMKALVSKINMILKSKYEQNWSQFESVFEGMDLEVENVYKRLESLQKKSGKYISELNDIINHINSGSLKENEDICTFRKDKQSVIVEIFKMLEDSKNFLNFKIDNTKTKVNIKMKDFKNLTEKFMKQTKIFENSVINSINTGISSSSLRLRRFSKFFKKIYQYYKTSSLICKVSSPLCLVGFGICGLFQSSNDRIENQSVAIKATKSIPIEIEVSELKNGGTHKDLLIKELHNLNLIVNSNDPTLVIYLNKAIHLKSDAKYLLTITNLHKESFLEIWCGEVAKVFQKNMSQCVPCNTSGITFEFVSADGVESDFNEFNSGIIADLIYSNLG